jgi:diguanylate cyclase (GGDEF)-like protein
MENRIRISRPAGVFFALSLICAVAIGQAPPVPRKPLRTLITAHQAHSLPIEEAARAYPVHLHAAVTYYDPYIDPRHGALFVCDASGCIFASLPSRPVLPLRPGDLVDVAGVSGTGDYAPVILDAQVRVIGNAHLPESAQKATMAELQSGALDGQWAEVEGVVRAAHLSAWNATLDIATTGGPVSATTLREAGIDYEALVDSFIRLRGNAAPVFNRKGQMVNVHLFFPSLRALSVVQPASGGPFSMPVRSIASLLHYSPGLKLARRVRVQGTVTLQWPGRRLCILEGSDGMCIRTAQATQVSVGDLVDVIGFPATSEFKATLENTTFRLAGGSAQQPNVQRITDTQAIQGDYDSELVQIEGNLIGQNRSTGDLTLMMRSANGLFEAILPQLSTGSGMPSWKDGSKLRLTGICEIQVDLETTKMGEGSLRTQGFRVLLRSAADVEVLRAPSWWTPSHTLEILVAVALLTFAAFAWVVVLRRRVEQQTKALRASEERLRHLSEHDALTNLPNRILLNDRLTMALQRAERFHENLGLLMVDVDRFKDVNDLYGHPAGDKLLCELAKRISHSVRLTDTVARIGGDEFIVLLPDLHAKEEAQAIAAKVVAAVSAPFHIGPARLPVPVTVSVGICTYPDAGLDIEKLLLHVDAAMYCVKARGRNGFQVYTPKECEGN